MARSFLGTRLDRVWGARVRTGRRGGRPLGVHSLPRVEFLEDRTLLANITPSGLISSTPDGSNFAYTIALSNSNTSTSGIGTFWYSWVPGEDFLATKPISVTPPTGWTDSITGGGASDGYAIEFIASTSDYDVQPGNSLNFQFTSADTPASVEGTSVFHTAYPVGTSYVYPVGAFSDAGHQFVVKALNSIAVTPANPSVPKGETEQFDAMGTFSDGSTQDLTTQVTWASATTSVATISNVTGTQGLATAAGTGTSMISATLDGISGSTEMTVSAAALQSIAVTPASTSLPAGETEQFTAIGTYSDKSTQNLSTQVTWASSDITWAKINSAGLATAVSPGPVTISATLGGITGSTALTVTAAALQSIAVTPASTSLPAGETEQFTATGTYSDNSTRNLSNQVTWASSDITWATISSAGLAKAVSPGPVTISATLGGITGSTALTVTVAALQSIAVTPAGTNLPIGETEQFTATGTYSDKSTQNLTNQVTWASSDISWDTISSAGLAKAVSPGPVTISATVGGITGSTALTVTAAVLQSIAVTPAGTSVPAGETEQFTATGTYSDKSTQNLSNQVTWASSDITWATINSAGLATAVSPGPVTISATLDGITGSTALTVTAAVLQSIAVTPANPSIALGSTEQFTAVGTYSDHSTQALTTQVTWASATASAATISNVSGSQGLATGVATGTSTISAAVDGVTGSTVLTVRAAVLQSIAVTPANPSVAAGLTEQFTAVGTYSDNSTQALTTQVTWASANTSVATISSAAGSQGLATAVATGTSSISAALAGVTGTTVLTVTAAVLQSIALTPAKPSVAVGSTEQFTAVGTYSDKSTQTLTTQVTWASATPLVATISNASGSQGLAAAVATGTSTISAAVDGVTGSTVLKVSAAVLQSIAVTPANPSVAAGLTEQFTAVGTYSDNSTQTLTTQVTWASATASVATISNTTGTNGLATAVSQGTSTISATVDGISGSTALTVSAPVLQSILVSPANPNVPKGESEQFQATGTFSDQSTSNITSQVNWTSSATATATISNSTGSPGLATSVAIGTATITASLGGVTNSTTMNVTAPVLSSITLSPSAPSVPKGETERFHATGTYSDSSTQDLTNQVTWATASPAVATISNATGTQGSAAAKALGTSQITATLGAVSASTTITVAAPALVSIAITPVAPSVPKGETEQFKATGTFSDSTTQDLTKLVTWSSSLTSVAAISNAGGSLGLATATGSGSSQIRASEQGITASTTLIVTPAALVSIAVTAANPTVATGGTEQFIATATLTDHSTEDLTNQVIWSSSPGGVATISAAGLATGVSAGSATISATLNGITGSGPISVATPPPPLVTVTKIVPVMNKKHQTTKIEVFFSALVNAAEADSKLTYTLKTPGKKNSFSAKNAGTIKIKSALYTAATNEVVLTPKTPFALTKPVQLTIAGDRLQDSLGRFIDGNDDGQSGGNRVVVITKKAVTITS